VEIPGPPTSFQRKIPIWALWGSRGSLGDADITLSRHSCGWIWRTPIAAPSHLHLVDHGKLTRRNQRAQYCVVYGDMLYISYVPEDHFNP